MTPKKAHESLDRLTANLALASTAELNNIGYSGIYISLYETMLLVRHKLVSELEFGEEMIETMNRAARRRHMEDIRILAEPQLEELR